MNKDFHSSDYSRTVVYLGGVSLLFCVLMIVFIMIVSLTDNLFCGIAAGICAIVSCLSELALSRLE